MFLRTTVKVLSFVGTQQLYLYLYLIKTIYYNVQIDQNNTNHVNNPSNGQGYLRLCSNVQVTEVWFGAGRSSMSA